MLNVFFNDIVFQRILVYNGQWKSMTLINKYAHSKVNFLMKSIWCHTYCPESIMNAFITKCNSLQHMDFTNCEYLTDEVVQFVYAKFKKIQKIIMNYCPNISNQVYQNKPDSTDICVYGCWRINEPDVSNTPYDVVEFQLNALNHIDEGGFDKMLLFVSEPYRLSIFNHFHQYDDTMFRSLISLTHYNIQLLIQSEESQNAMLLVSTLDDLSFVWVLCKESGLWNTTYIAPSNL